MRGGLSVRAILAPRWIHGVGLQEKDSLLRLVSLDAMQGGRPAPCVDCQVGPAKSNVLSGDANPIPSSNQGVIPSLSGF